MGINMDVEDCERCVDLERQLEESVPWETLRIHCDMHPKGEPDACGGGVWPKVFVSSLDDSVHVGFGACEVKNCPLLKKKEG